MTKWFETPDSATLCRGGGNGPLHPSQFVGMAFIDLGNSVLDVGCGSGASLEMMRKVLGHNITYKGVDFIKKHIDWCKENFEGETFEVQNAMSLKEEDKSWDVVWSRHVVDHLPSFEDGLLEQMRVARKRVVCILWVPLGTKDEHDIKTIKDNGKEHKDEFTNDYSREKVLEFLYQQRGWNHRVFEEIGYSGKRTDTVIVLERE